MGIRSDAGIRIATPVCGPVRNDIGFDAIRTDFGAHRFPSSVSLRAGAQAGVAIRFSAIQRIAPAFAGNYVCETKGIFTNSLYFSLQVCYNTVNWFFIAIY